MIDVNRGGGGVEGEIVCTYCGATSIRSGISECRFFPRVKMSELRFCEMTARESELVSFSDLVDRK